MRLDRAQVEAILDQHNAARPSRYGRCEHCNWTRHPCDVYDLAVDWLTMGDALQELAPKGRYWPVEQTTTSPHNQYTEALKGTR